MNLYKCIGKTKLLIIWTVVLAGFAGLFVFSEECKNGALNGILMCLGILVPSLFPFFILASFLAESHILDLISPVLNPVAKFLLGLRGICIVPVIMSLIGGYPVGAKAVATLYRNNSITKNEAERLSVICCFAGPGFLVTFVGVSLLFSKESGIILLSSQIISGAVLCVISRFIFGKNDDKNKIITARNISVSEAMVNSVNSAVISTAGMCGFVIAFSVVCNVLTEGFGADNLIGKSFASMLEITTGVNLLCGEISLELISALTAFGGVCVHLQIFRELKGIPFSKIRFYIFRLVQSGVCLFVTKLLLLVFPVADTVFSTISEKPRLTSYSGIAGTIALLITSALFIISVKHRRRV